MTEKEFYNGIRILISCGVQADADTLKDWFKILTFAKIDYESFRYACLKMATSKEDFYAGTNIPATIIEYARQFSRERAQKIENQRRNERFALWAKEERRQIQAAGSSEKLIEQNKTRMKRLVEKIG